METAAALSFAAVALAMALLIPFSRPLDLLLAAALTVSLALASRVHLHLGAGFAVPTQLVIVPMLFLLPPEIVPVCVGLGQAGGALLGTLRGREHPERIISGTADAWNAVGAALVVVAAGAPAAELGYWAVPLIALLAQCATDVLSATIREWLGRGIAPAAQVRVILNVYAIDACLTPVGFLVAMAATAEPFAFALILPLLALLAALAADRGARIREAVDRLDELTEEHARLDRAIHRIGEAFGSKLDRAALIDLGVRTAVEALGADFGRASLTDDPVTPAVAAAEKAARETGALRMAEHGEDAAMAQPLSDDEVLVIARRGRAFTHEDQALFGYLARQTALAIENVVLHDQLRRQATVDELTGLANHRRFQEALQQEALRTVRSGRPTGLALIDVDDFKRDQRHLRPPGRRRRARGRGRRGRPFLPRHRRGGPLQRRRAGRDPLRHRHRRRVDDRRSHPPPRRGARPGAAGRHAAARDRQRRRERARAGHGRRRRAARGGRHRAPRRQARRQEPHAQHGLGERRRRRPRPPGQPLQPRHRPSLVAVTGGRARAACYLRRPDGVRSSPAWSSGSCCSPRRS